MAWYGYDYDRQFGGNAGSNATATDYFSTDGQHGRLSVTLVWHLSIDWNTIDRNWNQAFYNLDLWLYDITDTDTPVLMAQPTSTVVDNTESIWTALPAHRDCMLKVTPGGDQTPFDWDYALAWQIVADGDRNDLPDAWELAYALTPEDPSNRHADPDDDALMNSEELNHGTNPHNPDTDGEEVLLGFSPTDGSSHPAIAAVPSLPPTVLALGLLFLIVLATWSQMGSRGNASATGHPRRGNGLGAVSGANT